MTRRYFMDSDFAIEDGREDELGAIVNFVERARGLDVGFDRRWPQPEDRCDIGIAVALPGEDYAFALARTKARGTHDAEPAAVHDPARPLEGKAADDLNRRDMAAHAAR